MANINLVTADRITVVQSFEQFTAVAAVAVTAGMGVMFDSAGKWILTNATVVGTSRFFGIAVKSVPIGYPVTAIRRGIMDGYVLDALAYDAFLYLSDTPGRIGVATDSTIDVIIGRVVPGLAVTLGTAADKLLYVDPMLLGAGVV